MFVDVMNTLNFNFWGFNRRALVLVLLICALCFLYVCRSSAQSSNMWRGSVAVGLLYERGLDATVSVEKELKYHNAFEVFFNGYLKWDEDPNAGHITKQSFWHDYNTWSVGMAYKPCVYRARNCHGNLRLGVSCGSDLNEFIGIVHLGYEQCFALRGGWEFFFQLKEDVAICAKDLFRTGVALGVKVPLSR